MSTKMQQEHAQRRLAWRCRRGMLELDIVLQRFIAGHFRALNPDEMQALDSLLNLPDNDFWQLISQHDTMPMHASTAQVLAKIKNS